MTEPREDIAPTGVSRRTFGILTGTAAAAAAVAEVLPAKRASAIEPDASIPLKPDYVAHVRRAKDQLMLTLKFYNMKPDFSVSPAVFTKVNSDKSNYLVVCFGPGDGTAPQHLAEVAYPLKNGNLNGVSQGPVPSTQSVGAPPIPARIAGQSRLAFVISDSVLGKTATHPLTLDTATLLRWTNLALSVSVNAVPPFVGGTRQAPTGMTEPRQPSLLQTAIEMPTGLIISPPAVTSPGLQEIPGLGRTVFVNTIDPVTHNGWTELWHTRLAGTALKTIGQFSIVAVDENNRNLRTIRALWAPDPSFGEDVFTNAFEPGDNGYLPHPTSLAYADRYDIVRLSSDFSKSDTEGGPYGRIGSTTNSSGFVPSPATVDLLMLTALGGWLDCDAHWDLPHANQQGTPPTNKAKYYNSSLLSWRHRATQARDSYVRVVRKGYLFPYGHKASLVTITEREPTQYQNTTGAYLRQKVFIIIGQPIKSYGGSGDFAPFSGRKLPFTSVEALTLITPDLNVPTTPYSSHQNGNPELVFEPAIGPTTFQFHWRGTDWAGDPIDFRSPVLWVDDGVAYGDQNPALITDILNKWANNAPTVDLHNQRVSVATPKDPKAATGDTQVVAADFLLGVHRPVTGTTAAELIQASQPVFYPTMQSMTVNSPEAKTASGNAVGGSVLEFEPSVYLANGFTGNKGGVFLSRVPSATRRAITFSGDKSGGAVTPNLGIDGISREIGPASGNIGQLAAGTFDPKNVFDSVNAKLLGGLSLHLILSTVQFGDGDNGQALQLISVEKQNPHRIVTTLDWHPEIKTGGPTIGPVTFTIFQVRDEDGNDVDTSDNSMDLHALIVTDLDHPSNSTTTVHGQIRNFTLNLFGDGELFFIQIPFDSLTFLATSGKKTDVDVQISDGGVQFKGALSFVQDLADYLSFAGSGLVIDTSGAAITATLKLAIPSLTVGVFSLTNLAFDAGVAIPYNGDPVRFDFSFCTRDDPFALTIMIFTGGGFVGIGIGADGVELLEFSFDFGLGYSIDIGIASGEISLVGGVYYESQKLPDGSQEVQLTAYIKASGGVSCLGIISVSVELYLALTYISEGGTSSLSGDATLSISVHILFFGGTISVHMHKQFEGSATDSGAPQIARRKRAALGGGVHQLDDATYPVNSFGASLSEEDWETYCTSFALTGVGV
jgi:hypothetical protein